MKMHLQMGWKLSTHYLQIVYFGIMCISVCTLLETIKANIIQLIALFMLYRFEKWI